MEQKRYFCRKCHADLAGKDVFVGIPSMEGATVWGLAAQIDRESSAPRRAFSSSLKFYYHVDAAVCCGPVVEGPPESFEELPTNGVYSGLNDPDVLAAYVQRGLYSTLPQEVADRVWTKISRHFSKGNDAYLVMCFGEREDGTLGIVGIDMFSEAHPSLMVPRGYKRVTFATIHREPCRNGEVYGHAADRLRNDLSRWAPWLVRFIALSPPSRAQTPGERA